MYRAVTRRHRLWKKSTSVLGLPYLTGLANSIHGALDFWVTFEFAITYTSSLALHLSHVFCHIDCLLG